MGEGLRRRPRGCSAAVVSDDVFETLRGAALDRLGLFGVAAGWVEEVTAGILVWMACGLVVVLRERVLRVWRLGGGGGDESGDGEGESSSRSSSLWTSS